MFDNSAPREEAPRAPGRPRDRERQAATIRATAELLREVGYGRLSIDAVARRAGVTRQLIYRWWGNKARLVMECLFAWDESAPVPDTGSFAGDLRLLIEEIVARYARPEMALGLSALQADLLAQPSLLCDADREFVLPWVARWEEAFERAKLRGEIPRTTRARAVMDVVVGAVTVLLQEKTLGRRAIGAYLCALLLPGIGVQPRSANEPGGDRSGARTGGSRRTESARKRSRATDRHEKE